MANNPRQYNSTQIITHSILSWIFSHHPSQIKSLKNIKISTSSQRSNLKIHSRVSPRSGHSRRRTPIHTWERPSRHRARVWSVVARELEGLRAFAAHYTEPRRRRLDREADDAPMSSLPRAACPSHAGARLTAHGVLSTKEWILVFISFGIHCFTVRIRCSFVRLFSSRVRFSKKAADDEWDVCVCRYTETFFRLRKWFCLGWICSADDEWGARICIETFSVAGLRKWFCLGRIRSPDDEWDVRICMETFFSVAGVRKWFCLGRICSSSPAWNSWKKWLCSRCSGNRPDVYCYPIFNC